MHASAVGRGCLWRTLQGCSRVAKPRTNINLSLVPCIIRAHRSVFPLFYTSFCNIRTYKSCPFTIRSLSTSSSGEHNYVIKIYTGDVRGAGTTANVMVTLTGSTCSVGPFYLVPGQLSERPRKCEGKLVGVVSNPAHCSFARGAVAAYRLSCAVDIGALSSLTVTHDDSEPGSDWYVDHIIVQDLRRGVDISFHCGKWICERRGYPRVFPMSSVRPTSGDEATSLNDSPEAIPTSTVSSPSSFTATEGVHLLSAAVVIPHPHKKDNGGEDAFVVVGNMAIGVADGVGEWRLRGVDAGLYSRSVMEYCRQELDKHVGQSSPYESVDSRNAAPSQLLTKKKLSERGTISDVVVSPGVDPKVLSDVRAAVGRINPVTVLEESYRRVTADAIRGSCTVCFLLLDGDARLLRGVNLGDSGFVVIRDGCVVYRSPQQEHSLGLPFQLSCNGNETPKDATVVSLAVEKGDIIVAGSDGLFDNVDEAEIVDVAWRGRWIRTQQVAEELAQLAYQHGMDRDFDSPFAKAATEEYGLAYRGGKMDDVTVIVAKVVPFKSPHL